MFGYASKIKYNQHSYLNTWVQTFSASLPYIMVNYYFRYYLFMFRHNYYLNRFRLLFLANKCVITIIIIIINQHSKVNIIKYLNIILKIISDVYLRSLSYSSSPFKAIRESIKIKKLYYRYISVCFCSRLKIIYWLQISIWYGGHDISSK